MIFASDSFTLGKERKTCQDYSLHDNQDSPFAIISDGCSSASKSEIGAMLNVMIAANILYNNENIIRMPLFPDLFYDKFMDNLRLTFTTMKSYIHTENLNATLIVAIIDKELSKLRILMYGDGVVRFNYLSGSHHTETLKIEYSNNTPYYPVYSLSQNMYHEFLCVDQSKTITRLETNEVIKSISDFDRRDDFYYCKDFDCDFNPRLTMFERDLDNLESAFIFSDGIESFYNKESREKLPICNMIDKITQFNNVKGEFITRRFISPMGLINEFVDNGIGWSDDVSVAGFIRR